MLSASKMLHLYNVPRFGGEQIGGADMRIDADETSLVKAANSSWNKVLSHIGLRKKALSLIMNIRKHTATGFLTIALLAVFTTALEADDMAYMLAGTGGATN